MLINDDVSIIYVPWYSKKSLDMLGLTLDALKDSDVDHSGLSRVSKTDIVDISKLTTLLSKVFHSDSYGVSNTCDEYETGGSVFDTNILESFISTPYDNNGEYDIVYSNNVIYVIVKEGFCNFIRTNNNVTKLVILKDIINTAFMYFNDDKVFTTELFRYMLTLDEQQSK